MGVDTPFVCAVEGRLQRLAQMVILAVCRGGVVSVNGERGLVHR
jgi:hypothetical protein